MTGRPDWKRCRRWFGAAVLLLGLLFLMVVLGPVAPATAAFPGDNGDIAFISDRNGIEIQSSMNTETVVTSGGYFSCARKVDGHFSCWGSNSSGQSNVPDGAFRFLQVSAGGRHACGLKPDHTAICWGENRYGQTDVPPDAGPFIQIGAGLSYSCGLETDLSVDCWGKYRTLDLFPDHPGPFVQISIGDGHNCGLDKSGIVTCWGQGESGQTDAPGDAFDQVSVAGWHSCGLKKDGSIVCWGGNAFGESNAPNDLTLRFTQVTTGVEHSCGLKTDGKVICWGENRFGQLAVPSGDFLEISAGWYHTCGLRPDRSIDCWGRNSEGVVAHQDGPFGPLYLQLASLTDRYDVAKGQSLSIKAPGVLANDNAVNGRPSVFLMLRFPVGSHRICKVSENAEGNWEWERLYPGCDSCPGQRCTGAFTALSEKGIPTAYYLRYLSNIQQWRIVEFLTWEDIMKGTSAPAPSPDSPLASTTVNGEPRIYYLSSDGHYVQELASYSGKWDHRPIALDANAPPAEGYMPLVVTSITNGDPRVYYLADISGYLHIQELAYRSLTRVWTHRDITAESGASSVSAGSPLVATTVNMEARLYYLTAGGIIEMSWHNSAWQAALITPGTTSPDAGRLAAIEVDGAPHVYYTHNNVVQELALKGDAWVWAKVGEQASADDVISHSISATNVNDSVHIYYTAADEPKPGTGGVMSQNIHELAKVGDTWFHEDITSDFHSAGWLLDANAISTLGAVTGNGPTLTANLVSGPSHGGVGFSPDGSFTYTPDPNYPNGGYSALDSFVYTVSDGFSNSRETTVTLEIVNECAPADHNLIQNYCFIDGKTPWRFFQSNRQGSFTLSENDPYAGEYSARVEVRAPARNSQLYQTGLSLQPNTTYELSFAARSDDGRNMSVLIHQHGYPYTNYGLSSRLVNLEPYWKWFTMTFTTPDLADMNDARLRFWFAPYAQAGTVYHIDRVMLRPMGISRYHMTLLRPLGGEIWRAGTTETIRWETDRDFVYDVSLGYTPEPDPGLEMVDIASGIYVGGPDWGSYEWTIPESLAGKTIYIYIKNLLENDQTVWSGPIKIVGP